MKYKSRGQKAKGKSVTDRKSPLGGRMKHSKGSKNVKCLKEVNAPGAYIKAIASFVIVFIVSFMILPSAIEAAPNSWDPQEEIESFLANNYPWDEIEVRNVRVKGKAVNKAPESIFVEKGPIGKAVFSFMYNDGRRVLVNAYVRVFESVLKSKRSFSRGHVITFDDLYLSKMDIRKIPKSAIMDPATIVGKSLKRSMSANVPIVENMIEMSRVIKRGKRVVLVINNSGLSITAYGKTREKGRIGMPVKAINLSSNKEVIGVLIDENTVKVEL